MRRSRFLRREEGVAAVEFAFTLPVLLVVVWAVIDFGRLLFATNGLATAVREGARYAAVTADPTGADSAAVKKQVRRAFFPLGGDTITNSEIVLSKNTSVSPNTVTVQVSSYPWTTYTPLAAAIGKSSLNLTRSATFRWEWGN